MAKFADSIFCLPNKYRLRGYMLKLIDITKEYKVDEESVLALNKVSIEFRKNEFVSILGPSGCGKTTLLNIVGGLDRYTSGDIQIDGVSTKEYDDVDWDTYRNRRIGFVFQSYNLIPHMNILKNVAMSLTLAGVEREERRQRAMEALEKVGLASQAKKKPNQLSGGQMQRVAIARALVNNPEIILADEPTGALDSESGIQVMDLLKEVARDRLVVMVTHNPSLAEEYSTRIVYLKDGEVVGDSMPYDSSVEDENTSEENGVVEVDDIKVVDEDGNVTETVITESIAPEKKAQDNTKAKKSFREKFLKWKKADRAAMKLSTAISLSWNNLLAKKGRTLLTSIAGSIGIIGIVLVLSLSSGASNYVRGLEESALSTYPLTIGSSTADINAILGIVSKEDEDSQNRPTNPDTDEIYTKRFLGKLMDNIDALLGKNNLIPFKKYVDENFDTSLATVKYNYGVNFNAFIDDPHNEELVKEYMDENPDATYAEAKAAAERYMKVNPYTEVMNSVLDSPEIKEILGSLEGSMGGYLDMIQNFTSSGSMFSSWTEISSNQKLLESQYELVGSQSKWPTSADEIIVVVDKKNQLLDYQLFMLGLQSQDDVINAFSDGWAQITTNLEQLLNLEYRVMPDSYYLELEDESKTGDDRTWTYHDHKEQNKAWVEEQNPFTVKVVGVVRPKDGTTVASINGVVGYTHALTVKLIEEAEKHPAVQQMFAREAAARANNSSWYKSCITVEAENNPAGLSLKANDTIINFEQDKKGSDYVLKNELMRALGVAELENPSSIEFYCASFEAKEEIIKFIEEYNAKVERENHPEDKIVYGDTLSTIMGFVNTMVSTITGVLVGFAAISLVVSTIMIAIIIYTSVLERRKEIGVLRSIGARKRDISRVFIAESAILGGYSGVIGIIISVALSFAGSAILKAIFQISGLMSIVWWHCLVMLAVSILLSMLAGFIPSRIAANKDPAIALRSE